MKNKYFFRTGITFLLSCLISVSIFSQVAVVGAIKNGKPVVTNLAEATAVLKGGLPVSAVVSNIYIDLEPESGKYFLIGKIVNDRISGKAVELKVEGAILKAVGGPGIEITCTGDNCGACVPKITNFKVRCVCEDNPLAPNYRCDMTSKVILTAW